MAETNIPDGGYFQTVKVLQEYFGHEEFSELYVGDFIKEGDVFMTFDFKVHPATNIGARYSLLSHYPHFRSEA